MVNSLPILNINFERKGERQCKKLQCPRSKHLKIQQWCSLEVNAINRKVLGFLFRLHTSLLSSLLLKKMQLIPQQYTGQEQLLKHFSNIPHYQNQYHLLHCPSAQLFTFVAEHNFFLMVLWSNTYSSHLKFCGCCSCSIWGTNAKWFKQ